MRGAFHLLRLPILLLCAGLALWGAHAVPEPDPLALAAAALGGFLIAYARLRHVSLALAATPWRPCRGPRGSGLRLMHSPSPSPS